MSGARASGGKRLPSLRSPFRYWLVVAVGLIALVSILPSAGHRRFRLYPYNTRVGVARRAAGEQPVGRRWGGGVGVASRPEATTRPRARASGRGPFRYLRSAVYWLAVAVASVALLAVIVSVGARLFGYSPYVMYGGSMGSTAPLGSLAFIEDVPAESLQVGDVVVFRPPSSGRPHEPVMHRIISVEEVAGQRVIRTKGDANESADPWELRFTGEGGRLGFVVPYAGYLLWFFQTRTGWVFVALPLLAYLGFEALRRIWVPSAGRKAARTRAP